MSPDHEAREAAEKAIAEARWPDGEPKVRVNDTIRRELTNAAIDAYNAKLREGMDDVRRVVGMVLAERLDDSLTTDEQFDAIADEITSLLALSARTIAPAEVFEVVRSRSDEYVREQLAKRRGMKSAQRQDHTELIAEAREWDSAITQSAPTTTAALIQMLADALEGKSDE